MHEKFSQDGIFYFLILGWKVHGSISRNIRKAFYWENIRKVFFWENIRIFFNIKGPFPEFVSGSILFLGGELEIKSGPSSSYLLYFYWLS